MLLSSEQPPTPWPPAEHGHNHGRNTAPQRGDWAGMGLRLGADTSNKSKHSTAVQFTCTEYVHKEAPLSVPKRSQAAFIYPSNHLWSKYVLIDEPPSQEHLPHTQKGRALAWCPGPAPHP